MQLDLYAVCRKLCLHKCREPSLAIYTYATSAIGIDVVSGHKLSRQAVSAVYIDIVSSRERLQKHIWYRKIENE